MFKLLSHYQVGRFSLVFLASCYASLRLTEAAIRPTVERVWRKLSSDEALDLYACCIVFLHDLAILTAKLAIAAGKDCRRWADAFVERSLAPAAVDQPAPLDQPEPASKTATVAAMEPWDLPVEPAPLPVQAPIAHFAAPLPALPPAKLAPQQSGVKSKRGRPPGSRNKQKQQVT